MDDIPFGAAGTMVITRYTMDQSLQEWETELKPCIDRFCRVMARLFSDKSYQSLFRTSDSHAECYAEYSDDA